MGLETGAPAKTPEARKEHQDFKKHSCKTFTNVYASLSPSLPLLLSVESIRCCVSCKSREASGEADRSDAFFHLDVI